MSILNELICDGYTIFYTICGEYDEFRLCVKCIDTKNYEFYIPDGYEHLLNDNKLLYKEYSRISKNRFRITFWNKQQFINAERLFLQKIDL